MKNIVTAMKEIARQVESLEGRVEKLEKAAGSTSTTDAADKRSRDTEKALEGLTKRVDNLEKKTK